MNYIYILSIIIILICILLITIILIQSPKKNGVQQSFVEKNFRFFGIDKTNEFLEKITWILFIIIFICILIFNNLLKLS